MEPPSARIERMTMKTVRPTLEMILDVPASKTILKTIVRFLASATTISITTVMRLLIKTTQVASCLSLI